jgi:hypothetical protein
MSAVPRPRCRNDPPSWNGSERQDHTESADARDRRGRTAVRVNWRTAHPTSCAPGRKTEPQRQWRPTTCPTRRLNAHRRTLRLILSRRRNSDFGGCKTKGPADLLGRGLGIPFSDSRFVLYALCLRRSVLGFCSFRLRTLLFQRRLIHRQRGSHNRMASRGNYAPMGDKAAKYAFTVGDGVLAKLKCVIHARLPSLRGLSACDHRSVQNDSNHKHDSPLHRHILPAAALLKPRISHGTLRCADGWAIEAKVTD